MEKMQLDIVLKNHNEICKSVKLSSAVWIQSSSVATKYI